MAPLARGGERMSAADAAWLRVETPRTPMVITAVLLLDAPLDAARLRALLEERLLARHPRFRQRVVTRGGPLALPCWEDDPDFDLDAHLPAARLAAPGGPAELTALVSRLLSAPLHLSSPPWRMHRVDGPGAGGALVVRLHHCIADGIALARVLLSLTDTPPGAPSRPPRQAPRGAAAPRAAQREGPARSLAMLGHLLTLGRDAPTALQGPLGGARRAAWSAPLPLVPVRRAAHAQGATVNDVAVAALAGALRTHLQRLGEAPPPQVRALLPVNLRPARARATDALGNHFGLVLLPLPVGEPHPRERLRRVAAHLQALRRSPQAAATRGLLRVLGVAPQRVEHGLLERMAARASLVLTSVPGPRQPVWVAGARLTGLTFWAPQPSPLGLGVSLFTYAGHLTVGVSTDAGLPPRPDVLVEDVVAELGALGAL